MSDKINDEKKETDETNGTSESESPGKKKSPEFKVIDINKLKMKKIAELTSIAKDLGITHFAGIRKQELIIKIVESQKKPKVN